jgi:hypothetical protein
MTGAYGGTSRKVGASVGLERLDGDHARARRTAAGTRGRCAGRNRTSCATGCLSAGQSSHSRARRR